MLPMSLSVILFSKDEDKIISAMFITFINLRGSIPFMVFCSQAENVAYNTSFLAILDFYLLFCGSLLFLCKFPIFLLHFWLTKAHVRASGLFSILLARIILKLGTFGLFKFRPFFFWVNLQVLE